MTGKSDNGDSIMEFGISRSQFLLSGILYFGDRNDGTDTAASSKSEPRPPGILESDDGSADLNVVIPPRRIMEMQ